MENLVFIELERRDEELFYYKSPDGKEVDFILKEGQKIKQLIQVCYTIEDFNTRKKR